MAQTKIEQGLLKFTEATDYLKIPTGTTAQRPSSPANGYIRFNTTINDVEAYNGTEWIKMSINPPTFSSVDYPGSATALDPAGGESLVINGSNFAAGITVAIGGTTPSSITLNSSTQLTVTTPAKTAGTYDIVFTNTDGGTATATNAVSYNGIPAFTNAAGSLGSVIEGSAVNLSAAATEPDGGAITYAITSGALPTGLSLNASTGAITGTAPSVSADTTSNFTVTATDNENQTSSRAYSITVTNIAPSDNFNIVTYTGDGTNGKQITGLGFQPDFVWTKARSTTSNNLLFDSTRGVHDLIISNSTAAEQTASNTLQSFNNGGFTLGVSSAVNNPSTTYVAWCLKANGGTTSSNNNGTVTTTVQANEQAGFSIVNWTGGSSPTATTGHGLSASPEFIILRPYNTTSEWYIWHKDLTSGNSLKFTTAAESTAVAFTVNSSVFYTNWTNTSYNWIAYCFRSVEGFSKFGSYTGNGSSNGPIVETGFEPAFVMIKRTDSTGVWVMLDNKRNLTNPRNSSLYANTSAQEDTGSTSGFYPMNFYSNGFQPIQNTGDYNANNATYIYMAFAADPDTTAPTLANSFNTVTYTGNGSSQSITGLGFSPSLVWLKSRSSTYWHSLVDTVRGAAKPIFSNSTSAQTTDNIVGEFLSDGFTTGTDITGSANGNNYVAWAWKADDNEPTINTEGSIDSIVSANANAGFSIVKFTGNNASSATIGHGLSSAPEMIIQKRLDSISDWAVYHSALGPTKAVWLNRTDSAATSIGFWNNTAPTSTVMSIENLPVSPYIHYCWHSVSGFSKIGSYTGATGGVTENIGFQPRWIMIKDTTDSVNNWVINDAVRDTSNPRTAILFPNLSGAEGNNIVFGVNFTSTGFEIPSTTTSTAYNKNGNTYIYLAIA